MFYKKHYKIKNVIKIGGFVVVHYKIEIDFVVIS